MRKEGKEKGRKKGQRREGKEDVRRGVSSEQGRRRKEIGD